MQARLLRHSSVQPHLTQVFAVYKWVLGDTDADDIENADIGDCAGRRLPLPPFSTSIFFVHMGRSRAFAALAFIIFGFFTIIVPVLMLNVLVAMFNKYESS